MSLDPIVIAAATRAPPGHLSLAERESRPILAEIRAHYPQPDAGQYTTAPIPALRKRLDKTGWPVGEVDLVEITFAMAAARDPGIEYERLHVNGGARALGHLSAPPARG